MQLLQAEILGVSPDQVATFLGWVNPPHFLFFVQPFAIGSYGLGWLDWVLATAVALGLAAVLVGEASAWGPAAWLLVLACAWRRDRAWRFSPARSGSRSAGT